MDWLTDLIWVVAAVWIGFQAFKLMFVLTFMQDNPFG